MRVSQSIKDKKIKLELTRLEAFQLGELLDLALLQGKEAASDVINTQIVIKKELLRRPK